MASQVGSLIRDQNLNVHYNGASAGGKTYVAKAPRKGVLGGRKPLGDLSNSVKPTPTNQSLKKQHASIYSVTDKEIGVSKVTFDGSQKKSFSIVPEKVQTSSRKALSDISNSGKPHLHEASKKNLTFKPSVGAEKDLSAIAEEGFLHNHQECIKTQRKAMDVDEFRRIIGLDNGFPEQSVSPWVASPPSDKLKLVSPPRYLELEEIIENQFADSPSPQRHEHFCGLDSPSPCSTPRSPNHFVQWEDINFTLIKTP